MMKEEFLKKYEEQTNTPSPSISDEDYKLIEYVYTFHPSISETKGKDQIVYLVSNFGMAIIKDMLARAQLNESLESEIRKTNCRLEELKQKYNNLKYGCD